VVFIDLDRFKVVNDSLGHAAGNELLKQIAQRLTRVVNRHDVVARLGGDEFAMLLESIESQADAVGIANAALRAIEVPVLINGTELQPNASIGITFSDMGYRTVDEMLRDADLAMYQAKVEGRHRIALFDSTMHEQIVDKLNLESEMRKSIAENQLALVYQPIYRLVDRQLVGFEALMRWTHPTRGAVSPGRFIPLAEESGFIKELTAWALNRAVQQLAEWHRICPSAADIGIHVNVSGADLTDQDLVGSVAAVLSRHAVEAERLTLEVTETMLMSKLKLSMANVDGLQRLGVGLSVDDFGTGYSSLAYLSSLPFDSLKIDRSFVSNVQQRPRNAEIVRAVLTLGLTLGKSVIAEGVETEEELRVLRDLGVPLAQGYLLSRPLNPEAAMQLLQNRTVNTR